MKKKTNTDEIIELAWCDQTSFDSIKQQTGLSETEVIDVMRTHLKPSSFKLWRKRVTGRKAKHSKKMRSKNDRKNDTDSLV